MKIKEKLEEKVLDVLLKKFLRNSGIQDMIEHPCLYKTTIEFEETGGVTLQIKPKEF